MDSILSHASVGTNDFARAVAFYEKVLAALSCKKVLDYPNAVAFGKDVPEFWVQTPIDGKPATIGNGTHFGSSLRPRKRYMRRGARGRRQG